MALATLKHQASKLLAELATMTAAENPVRTRLRADPARIMADAGMPPDPWQSKLLRWPPDRMLLLCSRQAGKSQTAAALALRSALLEPPALVLVLSRAQRQSGELFRGKLRPMYAALGRPVPAVQENALSMELANGSRIICLPGDEETIRCYSGVKLLIVDEAARVPDDLYRAVRPMLATSRGRLMCLSTPFGKRGFFYEEWVSNHPWTKVKITVQECPRITADFLAEEKEALGERWYQQEYRCSFEETIDAVFAHADIQAALSGDVQPLFGA